MDKRRFLLTSAAALATITPASADEGSERGPEAVRRGPLRLDTDQGRVEIGTLALAASDGGLRAVSRVGQYVTIAPANRLDLGGLVGFRPSIRRNWRGAKVSGVLKLYPAEPGVAILQSFRWADGSSLPDRITVHNDDREFRPRLWPRPPSPQARRDPDAGTVIGLGLRNADGALLVIVPPASMDRAILRDARWPRHDRRRARAAFDRLFAG